MSASVKPIVKTIINKTKHTLELRGYCKNFIRLKIFKHF